VCSYNDFVKRRAFKLFVFLLAGAIINVAVAWGIEVAQPASSSHEPLPPQEAMALSKQYLGIEWPNGTRYRSSVDQFDYVGVGDDNNLWVGKSSTGWPCLALSSVRVRNDNGSNTLYGTWDAAGELLWWLPLYPNWPGFAINTIFYAAIVWFLFFAVPGGGASACASQAWPMCSLRVFASRVCERKLS
jgi:hypothetical protein